MQRKQSAKPKARKAKRANKKINRRNSRKIRQTSSKTRTPKLTPKTAAQYFAMSEGSQDKWTRVTGVISKMRSDKISLTKAAREFGIDPRTVTRLGRSALGKTSKGRYKVRATDRLLRVLSIPTKQGVSEIAIRDSPQATTLAEYWNAVQRYLQTGDGLRLSKLRGKTITDARGKRIPLITDLAEIVRLGSAGVLSFESLYAKVG